MKTAVIFCLVASAQAFTTAPTARVVSSIVLLNCQS